MLGYTSKNHKKQVIVLSTPSEQKQKRENLMVPILHTVIMSRTKSYLLIMMIPQILFGVFIKNILK